MLRKLLIAVGLCLIAALLAPATAHAEDEITIRIAKHARLTSDGAMLFTAFVTCGPLPGVEDFTEAYAGGAQAKTGASGETGLDGTVVCDGVERAHTARVHPFDVAFKPGPAGANVSMIACRLVGDDQQCFNASAFRRVIIAPRR